MKGILFKPEIWKAKRSVLDQYAEAQTRRVIKLKGYSREVWDKCIPHNGSNAELLGEPYLKVPYDPIIDNAGTRIIARYHAGETVYIKEAYRILGHSTIRHAQGSESEIGIEYKDGDRRTLPCAFDIKVTTDGWHSPMMMPEKYARHFITITDVRAERLQEITERDAIAEGTSGFLIETLKGDHDYRCFKEYHHEAFPLIDHADEGDLVRFRGPNMGYAVFQSRNPKCTSGTLSILAKVVFGYIGSLEPDFIRGVSILWNSINPKYLWESNPFVFAYTFRRKEGR